MTTEPKLTSQRGGHKAFATKVMKDADTLLQNYSVADVVRMKSLLQTLSDRSNKIQTLDDQILEALTEEKEINDEIMGSSEYHSEVQLRIIGLSEALAKLSVKDSAADDDRKPPSSTRPDSEYAKLPRINVEKFDGDYLKFQEWWETYNAAVHSNPRIDNAMKFNYLRGYLTGTASSTISGISLVSENYDEAINLLKSRFGNKQALISAHIDKLLNLPLVSQNDTPKLRNIYDIIEVNVRSLKSLEVDTQQLGPVLVQIVMQKLPDDIKLLVSRHLTTKASSSSTEPNNGWEIDELISFVKQEIVSREMCHMVAPKSAKPPPVDKSKQYWNNLHVSTKQPVSPMCIFCQKNHPPHKCETVTDVETRKSILKSRGCCFVCLRSGHISRRCNSKYKCGKCQGRHNIALCEPRDPGDNPKPPGEYALSDDAQRVSSSVATVTSNMATISKTNVTLLQTARAIINDFKTKRKANVRVLFDNCAQKSFITEAVQKSLGLVPVKREPTIVSGFGGKCDAIRWVDIVKATLTNETGTFSVTVLLTVVPIISNPISNQNIELARTTYDHLMSLKLADSSDKGTELDVDVMIGADYYYDIVSKNQLRGNHGPVATETPFGWVLNGAMEIEKSRVAHHAMLTHVMSTQVMDIRSEDSLDFNNLVQKFWQAEEIFPNEEETDVDFVEKFKEKIQFDGTHYSVPLPVKEEIKEIPDNFNLTKGRTLSLLRDLRRSKIPNILEDYDQLIQQQDIDGYTEIVSPADEAFERAHYLPHRPVIRDSATTPIRMVCDPSAKMKNCPSLNDCLDPGPSLLPKLFDLLVRFRCFKFVLIGDVKSAFMNLRVQEPFRDYLRFMWVSNIHATHPEIIIRRFTSVLHGLNCAPFMLGTVITKHMNQFVDTEKELVEKFLRDLYMDDLISGAQTQSEAFDLYTKSKELMLRAGLRLLKWATNSNEMRKKIADSEVNVFFEDESVVKDGYVKVLGVLWNAGGDWIEASMIAVLEKASGCIKFTLRFVMKVTATHFDPMGLLAPVIIIFKVLLQDIHQLKVGWDTVIEGELYERWQRMLDQARNVPVIRVPRNYLSSHELCDVTNIQLHGFSDASGKAHGCVVYLRVTFANGEVTTRFVAAKARVNPNKERSIPRLELMACLLLAKLLKVIRDSITDYVIDEVHCWTDSIDCVWWINTDTKVWPRFVQNRVKKARHLLPGVKFKHCPGKVNPADIPSRGDYLIDNDVRNFYLGGAAFLLRSPEHWPQQPQQQTINDTDTEPMVGEPISLNTTVENSCCISKLIDVNNFKSFRRLVLVTSYVYRFINNLKARKSGGVVSGEISLAEKLKARAVWLSEEQRVIDDKKFNQLMISLGAYRDESDDLIKLKGRLEHSDLVESAKAPIFIPKESALNDLIIADAHRKVLHSGMKDTLNEVRDEYWLVRGRSRVKGYLYRCYLCKKYGARLLQKLPAAPLPDVRAQYSDPFTVTGVDYIGPLYVYPTPTRKGAALEKVHVVLFTCAISRAVHLDLVPDASSAAFVNCLRRFVSRRGIPKLFISDNAKCFLGPELKRFAKERDIEWQFIMEKSPWWGGFYERMVQVVKRPLRKILRRSNTTYDELLTILTEIEAVVNCRPLCYIYSDDTEENLTPSHLLNGRRLISANRVFPNEIVDETPLTLTNRVKYLRSLIDHFERRWKHEYLTELREYQRNHDKLPAKQLKPGDVVLISEDTLPRNRWRMGKVEELIQSKDGYVRACKLRVYNEGRKVSFLNRPVNKLCYFEVSSEDVE